MCNDGCSCMMYIMAPDIHQRPPLDCPVSVHKDERSRYAVTVPDLPECFCAAETRDEALAEIKDTIELRLERLISEGESIPQPGRIEDHNDDPLYAGWAWSIVSIDPPAIRAARIPVIEAITRAFDGLSREDGITLHEADAIRDCACKEKQAEARKIDAETRWQDVPPDEIEKNSGALCYMDLKGFRYYLPAYLVWWLKYADTSVSFTTGSTIYNLSSNAYVEYFDSLNEAQRQAICRFLQFLLQYGDEYEQLEARKSLRKYWGQFCKDADGTESCGANG